MICGKEQAKGSRHDLWEKQAKGFRLRSRGPQLMTPPETFAPFGRRPLLPSGETLAALAKTLNPIGETFAPLGGDLCSLREDLESVRPRSRQAGLFRTD